MTNLFKISIFISLCFTFSNVFSLSLSNDISYEGPEEITINYMGGAYLDYKIVSLNNNPGKTTIYYSSSKGWIQTAQIFSYSFTLVEGSDEDGPDKYIYEGSIYLHYNQVGPEEDKVLIDFGYFSKEVKTKIKYQGISNNSIGSAQTISEGNAPASLIGSTPGGGNGQYSYTWQYSHNNHSWINIPGSNSKNYSPGILFQSTFFRRVVQSSTLPNSYVPLSSSNSIKITVSKIENKLSSPRIIYCSGNRTPDAITGNTMPGTIGQSGMQLIKIEWQRRFYNVNSYLPGYLESWHTVTSSSDNQHFPAILSNYKGKAYFRRVAIYSGPAGNEYRWSNIIELNFTNEVKSNNIYIHDIFGTGNNELLRGNEPLAGSCISYQWQKVQRQFDPNPGGGGPDWINTWVNISGQTQKDYAGMPYNGTYRRVVYVAGVANYSNYITLYNNPNSQKVGAGFEANEEQLTEASIYPNPCTSSINFSFSTDEVTSLEIYDIRGQLILQQKQVDQQILIPDNIKNGTYLVKVLFEDGRAWKKLIQVQK